jgi:alpha-tubulin suppressor-like RCC1 family protein
VDAGGRGACALKPSGRVYCWGEGSAAVAQVGTSRYFSSISVGGDSTRTHACGISATDSLTYCWGANDRGQLGIGSSGAARVETPTAVSTTARFVSVSAGGRHTCALTAAGEGYCWGANGVGQLAVGPRRFYPEEFDGSDVLSPTRVSGSHTFLGIAAGDNHSCAVSDESLGLGDNLAYCWGDATIYEVYGGAWTTYGSELGYRHVCEGEQSPGGCPYPTRVGAPDTLRRDFSPLIAAGGNTTCARTLDSYLNDGRTYCWGRFTGSSFDFASSEPLRVDADGSRFTQLSAGFDHVCGLRGSSWVQCWGRTDYGQTPGGGTNAYGGPTYIQPDPRPVDGDWQAVSAGTHFTCAIAAGSPNKPYCWGRNDAYQLGNGGTSNSPVPVVVRAPR